MSIIGIKSVINQFAYIQGFYNICKTHSMKCFCNIVFIYCKVSHGINKLTDVNKVKAITDQYACLEVFGSNKDIIMTLFGSLSMSYEYLITTFKMMSIYYIYITIHYMMIFNAYNVEAQTKLRLRMLPWYCDKTKVTTY